MTESVKVILKDAMLNKRRKLILIVIILLGFCLRYYAATSISINYDEWNEYPSVKEISFEPGNINLPFVSKNTEGSIGYEYLVRMGWYCFGDSLLGARLPFIILGTLTILIIYFITKLALGTKTALLASFLLSISQYHISLTKSPEDDGIMFFGALSLLLFYKAIKTNKKLMLLNGVVLGVGYWFKEYIFLLIPIYIIFLIVCSEYRIWLRSKYVWISFITAFCLILPNFYLSLSLDIPRVRYFYEVVSIGISMNAIGTYLGELILLILRPFPEIFELAASSRDSSISLVTFVFGFVILIAVARSIKDKKPFVQLLLVYFFVNFIIFSFLRAVLDGLNSIWCLGNMDWVCLSFIPGVILAANMLVNCIKKYGYIGKLFLWFLIIFMVIRAVDYITFPLNCQVPIRNFQIIRNQLCDLEMYLEKGDSELANNILGRIFKVADKRPVLKKMVDLKLSQVLMQEEKYREKMKYLSNIFSRDLDNDKVETENVSDATYPVKLNSIIASGPIMDLKIKENFLYVAAGKNGVYIFDISNPQDPQKISSIISNDLAYSISVLDDFLYLSCGDEGFHILDIANPAVPREISSFSIKGIVKDVFVYNNYAYLACGKKGLYILDISDPFNPKEISHFKRNSHGDSEGIFVHNNYAYLACGKKGLYILDISDPFNPKEISHFKSDGDARDIFIYNNYAYLACNNVGLYVLDISNPSGPKEIFCFEGEDFIEDVYIYRDYVYLILRDAGFYTLDISNSFAPEEVSHFDADGFIEDMTIRGDYAYLACEESGFYILDISDVFNPKEIFHFEFDDEDYAEGIFVHNNYAYLACEESGFRMFDISDPANSKEVFNFDTMGIAEGVFIRGNYAYLACDGAGLYIFDISKPFAPKEVSHFDVNCDAVDIFVYNNYAYLACGESGFYILDISDPFNPKQIFQFDINDSVQDVFIYDNYAYLACEKSGLRVLDISNFFNLKETFRFDIDGFTECIFMDDNYIYLGYEKTKVHTLDIHSFFVEQKR